MKEWSFAIVRSLLIYIFDSDPTVSSRMYREVPLTSIRSGLRESLVIMLGNRNEGRSAAYRMFALDKHFKFISCCQCMSRKIKGIKVRTSPKHSEATRISWNI